MPLSKKKTPDIDPIFHFSHAGDTVNRIRYSHFLSNLHGNISFIGDSPAGIDFTTLNPTSKIVAAATLSVLGKKKKYFDAVLSC